MNDYLKPCPFCGCAARRIEFLSPTDYNFGGSCIECTGCQASSAVEFEYKETLYARWNRRYVNKTIL
jgi:Lar family restriction alleviation protein